MARQEINWNEIDPDDFWLWEELDDLYTELDESGVEDATEWEHFGAIESILYTLAERAVWRENYPREQYEADRKRMIAEGVDPRCIMSYSACMAYDFFKAEEEAYDEWEAEQKMESDAEIAAEVLERDELLEMVEISEQAAISELGAFGSCQGWFYGEPDVDMFGTRFQTRVWSDERYLVGEEWDAWDAATDDIPERFFELDWSM